MLEELMDMTFETFYHTTLGELLTTQDSRHADKIFLWSGDEVWTYAEAEKQANALAAGLRALGLEPGDRLSIILPNTPAYVLAIFAAATAGLIFTPINVRRKKDEVLARLGKTSPSALITDAEQLPLMQEL